MFHLQPGVHLHEIEAAILVQQELHRAGAAVVDRLCRLHRGIAHLLAQRLGHTRGGRLLDHFLVTALHRAVPLRQVDTVAGVIAKHL